MSLNLKQPQDKMMLIKVIGDYIRIELPVKFDFLAATEMINKIADVYAIRDKRFNRFFNLSDSKQIDLNFVQMTSIIVKFKHMKGDIRNTKSVFLVDNNIQFGFARMFQTMMSGLGTDINIFFNEDEAVNWISNGKAK